MRRPAGPLCPPLAAPFQANNDSARSREFFVARSTEVINEETKPEASQWSFDEI